ncbi:MAG: hypothetical protein HQ481_20210 [Alphaproteobacteria bacterium]|nr:hypothetical protein [Alphaproteobacteria bacterium]
MRLLPAPVLAVILAASLALAGCLHETKADIIKKAGDAATAEQLRAALGEPDELNKAGPLEEWIYDASDGIVRFPVIAGQVGPVVTGEKKK